MNVLLLRVTNLSSENCLAKKDGETKMAPKASAATSEKRILFPSKSIKRYFNPDPNSPDHVYVFSGPQSNIIISSVIFTFIVQTDRIAWTLDYKHYNTTWAPHRGANLYVDLLNAAGGVIPGEQIFTVVDHGHCTYNGAEPRSVGVRRLASPYMKISSRKSWTFA
jgi:hypothetical protein